MDKNPGGICLVIGATSGISRETAVSAYALDPLNQQRMWEVSARLTQLKEPG